MKNFITPALRVFPWLIIIALIVFFRGCSGGSETIKVTTPEIKGDFPQVIAPKPLPAPKPIYITTVDSIEVETPNPINEDLFKKYVSLKNDSISNAQKNQMYADAIQVKDYKNIFDDDNVNITIFSKTQGDLLSVKPEYVIKPRTIEVKQKQTVFRVYAGAEIGNTLLLEKFRIKGNLRFQNKKGDMISVGYDNQKNYYLGYDISLLNFKK